jgi:8-oxo-dGTP pyrophosphatase MutT (NUDIX family)
MTHPALAAFRTYVEPAFRRPEFVQTAALCTRKGAEGTEVLLISSLTTKRWILPKGWPMDGKSLALAALTEAWEEAGVQGTVNPDAISEYRYRKEVKGGIPVGCRCAVFHVEVTGLADDWPEKGRRRREWVTPKEAATRVDEPELKAILRNLA